RPAALELAVLVAAVLAADLGVELEVLALLAREQRVRAQLVDHRAAPLGGGTLGEFPPSPPSLVVCLTGTAREVCPPRSPCAAGSPPSRRPEGFGGGRDGPRTSPRTCRSTRAPSSWRRGRGWSARGSGARRPPGACAASRSPPPPGCRGGPRRPSPGPCSPPRSAS